MLDLCRRVDKDGKVDYVWFDTGLEYQATKDHLAYLEEKYGISIIREKAVKPIPLSCKVFGQPFISKRVSDMIGRLQRHGFDFKGEYDTPFEALLRRYPKCRSALRWWGNQIGCPSYCVAYNSWLKEFMAQHPPTFKISSKCCQYAKKNVIHAYNKKEDVDMSVYGVRKAEGGIRAITYKSCFSDGSQPELRPIFWYSMEDREAYEKSFGITHSDCYAKYGLQRTGCAGCPYGRNFEEELKVIEKYEQKLYKAVNNIFKDSYAYTRQYHEFQKMMNEKYGSYRAFLRGQTENK